MHLGSVQRCGCGTATRLIDSSYNATVFSPCVLSQYSQHFVSVIQYRRWCVYHTYHILLSAARIGGVEQPVPSVLRVNVDTYTLRPRSRCASASVRLSLEATMMRESFMSDYHHEPFLWKCRNSLCHIGQSGAYVNLPFPA